jgi:hypothetical protein
LLKKRFYPSIPIATVFVFSLLCLTTGCGGKRFSAAGFFQGILQIAGIPTPQNAKKLTAKSQQLTAKKPYPLIMNP